MLSARSSKFKLIVALLLSAFMVVGVTACGSSDDGGSDSGSTSTEASSDQPLAGKKIAYIKAGALEYYEYSEQAAKMAIEALGGEAVLFNSDLDSQKEQANVQDAITQGVDGIIFVSLSDAGTKSAVRKANQADIPFVNAIGMVPEELIPDMVGTVSVDFENLGQILGEHIAEVVPDGSIGFITGAQGRAEVDAFGVGLKAGLGDASRIVQTVDGQYLRQKAVAGAQDIVTRHPDLAALVVGNEDMAVGAAQGLGSKLNNPTKMFAQNGSPEGLQMLKQGKLQATVGESPGQENTLAVRMMADAINDSPPAEQWCKVPIALDVKGDIQSQPWEPTPERVAEWLKSDCAS